MRACSPDYTLTCAYCGSGLLKIGKKAKKTSFNLRGSVDHFEPKHLPHVHPTDMTNFVVSCVACNNEKDDKEGAALADWIQKKCEERRKHSRPIPENGTEVTAGDNDAKN